MIEENNMSRITISDTGFFLVCFMDKRKILKIVESGMLCALGVVFMLVIRFSIFPGATYLEYDMGDIPIIIATLLLGLKYGYAILFFVSGIQAITVSAASSWEGFVMHFIATGLFILILYFFTKNKKTEKKLIIGCLIASVMQILIMIPLNIVLTPIYLGCTVNAVIKLLIPAIIPFNAIKAGINSVLTVILIPILSAILKKNKLITEN